MMKLAKKACSNAAFDTFRSHGLTLTPFLLSTLYVAGCNQSFFVNKNINFHVSSFTFEHGIPHVDALSVADLFHPSVLGEYANKMSKALKKIKRSIFFPKLRLVARLGLQMSVVAAVRPTCASFAASLSQIFCRLPHTSRILMEHPRVVLMAPHIEAKFYLFLTHDCNPFTCTTF